MPKVNLKKKAVNYGDLRSKCEFLTFSIIFTNF